MKKRQFIINTAVRLFAGQGYDATTTMQISREAKVTEPLIYYHFKNGKEELFTYVLKNAFEKFFERMDKLPKRTVTQFEKIEALVDLYLDFAGEDPNELYLVVSACPVKIKDPNHICTHYIERQQKTVTEYLSKCLQNGIRKGEFVSLPVRQTTALILSMFNGVLQSRYLDQEDLPALKKAAVEFCRRSLLK